MDQQPDSIARDFHKDIEDTISGDMSNGKHQYIDEMDPEAALHKIKTSGTGSVTITSDLFERLYLQPKIEAPPLKHPLQRIFGNPTPLAIIGFEMSLMPITMSLMEWRGAGGSGASQNSMVIFYGGVLMWIGGFLEFLLGNTFPFLVFMSFGSFYCSYGTTLIPSFASFSAFSDDPVNDPWAGLQSAKFNASYGHYWVVFTLLMFLFWICTLRTNVCYVLLFTCIVPACGCIAGVFYHVAEGQMSAAHDCQVAAGALLFAANIIGWYILAGLTFPSVDFPIPIPLGDLQQVVPGLSEIMGGKATRTRPSIFRKSKEEQVEDAV